MADFSARKSHSSNGNVAYDLFQDGKFFAVVELNAEGWCFLDLDDEKRGRKVRTRLTRRLGRGFDLKAALPLIREEYA